jgi:hypothetical protein
MKDYVNIPASGFKSNAPTRTAKPAAIFHIATDIISLSMFSVVQLIAGFKLLNADNTTVLPWDLLSVLSKLYDSTLDVRAAGEDTNLVKLSVTRKEVIALKEALEARMLHCEHERDARSENFNADTYIGMKLLLIDIREWLLGEAITMSIPEMQSTD